MGEARAVPMRADEICTYSGRDSFAAVWLLDSVRR